MPDTSKYAVFKIGKIKSMSGLVKAYNHNYRTDPESVINADPSKVDLDEELIPLNGRDYKRLFQEKIHDSDYYIDHKIPSNAVYANEIMLTYTSNPPPEGFDLERWKEKNMEFLKEEFGDNLVSATLHMDEATPHIHALVIPMVNGHLSSFHYFKGKRNLAEWQDKYAEAMEEFNLKRGIKYSKATYRDTARYREGLERAREKAYAITTEPPLPDKGDDLGAYVAKVKEAWGDVLERTLDHQYAEQEKEWKHKTEIKRAKGEAEKAKAEFYDEFAELKELLKQYRSKKAKQRLIALVQSMENVIRAIKSMDPEDAKKETEHLVYLAELGEEISNDDRNKKKGRSRKSNAARLSEEFNTSR